MNLPNVKNIFFYEPQLEKTKKPKIIKEHLEREGPKNLTKLQNVKNLKKLMNSKETENIEVIKQHQKFESPKKI